jgi:uncharacterized membrane protein YqjE
VGLLDSAQALIASMLTLARTRLELFGTELQEELARLFIALLCAVAVLLLGALAGAFSGFALIVSLDEEYRASAAGVIALVFLALAAAAAWGVWRLTRVMPRAFDASLTELERDYDALRQRAPEALP